MRITENIDRLLESVEQKPVIALDFGGGLGLSWMRIAAQPKYKEAIEQGKLVMLVTNLDSSPNQTVDESGYWGAARSMRNSSDPFSEADLRWAQENQSYLQYSDANVLELPNMTINLPDGTPIPLLGNVGIIHERLVLSHTHIPDLALASFGELLSSQGIFYSDTAKYYHFLQSIHSGVPLQNGEVMPLDDAYHHQRRLALVVGSKVLQQQGFSYKLDEEGDYGIFSRLPESDTN